MFIGDGLVHSIHSLCFQHVVLVWHYRLLSVLKHPETEEICITLQLPIGQDSVSDQIPYLFVTSFFPFTKVVDVDVRFTAPFAPPPPPPPFIAPNELSVEKEEKPPPLFIGTPKKLSINCRPPNGLKNCASSELLWPFLLVPFLRPAPFPLPFIWWPFVYIPGGVNG